jgi:mannose-6-phosphate isomerase class I
MSLQKKPYLIIPFLIEQPTWGGEYICEKKGWLHKTGLEGKKIGQSYELYDRSLLATTITSTSDVRFGPTVEDTISISSFREERPFPLIKFTQAKGNSFQLHVKPNVTDSRWKQKAESWYYFENGKITYGIKKGIDISKYKETCIAINNTMKKISKMLEEKTISKEQAQKEAKSFIHEKNPWQFVNVHEVKRGDIVDLSGGGLHHSWEEDMVNYPMGNILYEVQQDVMDPICTIRSFDQGKFKDDGTIREIHIDDYFKYIDTDEKRNTLSIEKNKNGVLFDTDYYSLSLLSLSKSERFESSTSFHHLFVKEGKIVVSDMSGNTTNVEQGHSCFIPKGLIYMIEPKADSEILLTFLR